MGYQSIQEVLERVRDFEGRLERYYAAIRDQCKNEGVRLLSYYLSRHRRHLEEALEGFGPVERARIGNVRLKLHVAFSPEAILEPRENRPCDLTGRQLLEAAVEYDRQLAQMYRLMLEQPLGEEAEKLVRSLLQLEEKDIVMLKKMIAMDYF